MIANPGYSLPVGAIGVGVTGMYPPAATPAPTAAPPPPAPVYTDMYGADPNASFGTTASVSATVSTKVYWASGCSCCCVLIIALLIWYFYFHKKKGAKNGGGGGGNSGNGGGNGGGNGNFSRR